MDDKLKNLYLAKLAGQLNDLDKKLDELKAKAALSASNAKAEYEKTVDELRGKRKEAGEHLKKLKVASGMTGKSSREGPRKPSAALTSRSKMP